MAKQVEVLRQINTSLPVGLVEFLERQAALADRTVSGMIRHVISEAARLEVRPPKPFGIVLPSVNADAKSIADARALIAQWQQERARIARRRRTNDASAADDDRTEQLKGLISIMQDRIKIAEMMLKPNGARPHG